MDYFQRISSQQILASSAKNSSRLTRSTPFNLKNTFLLMDLLTYSLQADVIGETKEKVSRRRKKEIISKRKMKGKVLRNKGGSVKPARGKKSLNGGKFSQLYIITLNRKQLPMEEDSQDLFRRFDFEPPSSEEDSNQPLSSQKNHFRNENLLQQLNNLSKAKERFKEFLEELGELKRTPIRQDILQYCGQQKKSEKVIENHTRPESIIKKLQTRIEKMQKTRRIKRNWGQEDLKILIWIISKYSDLHGYQDLEKDIDDQDWKIIASYIPGVTPQACMFKWLSIKKITLATYKWLEPESLLLERIVLQRIGHNPSGHVIIKDWKQISQELYRLNQDQHKVYRNAKQCKEHWNCHLNPELKKGLWQPDQDIKLLRFIRDNKGLKKWSQLARHFDGRTENALKNRHKLIVQKLQKQAKNRHKEELQLISDYLQKLVVDSLTNQVHLQEDHIFEEPQDNNRIDCEQIFCQNPKGKKEEFNQDTNDQAITPARVEKFNIINFRNMDFHFLKSIQPGTIESDGTFKRMAETLQKEPFIGDEKDQVTSQTKKVGPFKLIPIHSQLKG